VLLSSPVSQPKCLKPRSLLPERYRIQLNNRVYNRLLYLFSKLYKLLLCVPVCLILATGVAYAQETAPKDSIATVPDSALVGIKIYKPVSESILSKLSSKKIGRFYQLLPNEDKVTVTWDTLDVYTIQRTLAGQPAFIPTVVSFDEYAIMQKDRQKKALRLQLVEEARKQQTQSRGLLDFKIKVPGGEKSAFTTIFGKPEVNLRVNGSANMNVGASIQKVESPNIPEDQQKTVDPTFNQNLQLNIEGSIGDKLTIATDWDTERQFDFQNRLKIEYKGYEDEIIKQIEMGNVSMDAGNSLISGGGSLFGIKSVAEVGPLRLTSVISQQKGESNSQNIKGGAQEVPFSLRPAEYDDDRHFFIDFYNRQVFEDNVSNPQQLRIAYQVTELNVWIQDASASGTDADAVKAYTFVDLGVNDNGNGTYGLPGNDSDVMDDELLDSLRSEPSINPDVFNLPGELIQEGYYKLLQRGTDYDFDEALGIVSLRRRVGNEATLAVSFSYRDPVTQQNVRVGDVLAQSSGYSYFKLLRPKNLDSGNKAWPLTLRNIYSLGINNVTSEGLTFDLQVTRSNIDSDRISGRSTPLIQDLGLDRLNTQGAATPDNLIDFGAITFDAGSGRIMFPYLEPFGSRMEELIADLPDDQSGLVFKELYTEKQSVAANVESNRFFRISGNSAGGMSSTFLLGAFSGIVEGSVHVYANGVELNQGTDYEVDYSFGSVTILNDRYLAAGQDIRIDFESNQFAVIGQKNFTGLRAEYEFNNDIKLGSTFFRLNEQPNSDKIRIGNEPINNTLLGLDASARFDTPWLTRAIDRIPLLQTKEASNFSLSGEFAQLRPGVSQTNAIRDAIKKGKLYQDEEEGLVFIDDFEGAKYSIPFNNPTRWHLPAAPAAIPGYAPDQITFDPNSTAEPASDLSSRMDRSDLRAKFSYYDIPRNVTSILGNVSRTPESRVVFVKDIFQGRETNNPQEEVINTLDVYYNPTERGPYNYNMNLKDVLENTPEKMWGGMTAVLPSGQEDLAQNNIEFLEFWVQSVLPDGQAPSAQDVQDYNGKIYIDLGIISEDIVPNFRPNSEDGLATELDNLERDISNRSFVPSISPKPMGQFSNDRREFEDVGLDGVPSHGGYEGTYNEHTLFESFVNAMRDAYGPDSDEFKKIEADPSNDDYIYYGESKVSDLKLHERFHRIRGYHEGNTPVSGGEKRAITLKPDKEALRSSSNIQQSNSYFQYEIDYNPADFNNLEIGSNGTFIVDKVDGGVQERTWRLVRIPLTEFIRTIGNISDFQNISYIRIWMSGYKKPFTLRFATLEFVGSQWRGVTNITESQNSNADFKVSTVNIEENGSRAPIPYRQPEGSIRAVNRGAQVQSLANEQSLVLQTKNLGPGEMKMVKRVYPGGLNLLNYSNIRMFVHGEGYDNRSDAELVVRMGSDLENDFYEYRQPVTPSDPNYGFGSFNPDEGSRLDAEAEQVWLYDENSMNIIISAFNVLKQDRNSTGANPSELYERRGILGSDAAPGAVIAIKGNPSLDKVSELALGIRNPYDMNDPNPIGTPILDAEMWVNELRVSGFDNENGWAANAKANFKLADFATVNANYSKRTSGFGGLESRLGNREKADQQSYSLSSTVNMHKFVPDRYNWTFPVTVSTRRSVSTPKFLPDQGDVRLDDFKESVNIRQDASSREKRNLIDDKIHEIQSVSQSNSLNISNISKSNSKGKLAQHTIDNLKLSYVYNEGYSRNPQLQFQDTWNYTTGVNYNLNFKNVRLFRPFKFTEKVPVIGTLAALRVGYMPSSISASASLIRSYDEKRRLVLGNDDLQPIQQTHTFSERSNFGLNYNLTPSIQTSFRSATNYDLSSAGIKEGNGTGVDSLKYRVRPTFEVLSGLVSDTLAGRRTSYQETYTASWRPRTNNIKALDWLSYSTSYGGGYQWNNSASGSNLGAKVSNTLQLDNTAKINTEKILNGFSFIENMRKEDAKATKERGISKADSLKGKDNIFEDAQYIGRKLFLSVFSMKNLDLGYKRSKTSSQAGYSGDSQIYYAFASQDAGTYSPPLGYRLGLNESIPRRQLIDNVNGVSTIQLPVNNTYSDNITLGTRLTPFKNLSIDLDWGTGWRENTSETLNLGADNNITSANSASGEITSSVWAFGKGYGELFKAQLATAFEDLDGNVIRDDQGNQDGRTVLNRTTLQEDFRRAYLGSGTGAIGDKNFTPIPKPDWRITWQGVEKLIPIIGEKMSRASITHAYKGTYRLGWQLNTLEDQEQSQSLGGIFTVFDFRDRYEPSAITVEQRFSPLIQLNITWKSALKTDFGFDRNRITSLALSSKTVTERVSKGFKFNLNYTFRRVRIPMFPKIRNNIDLSLNGAYSEDSDQNFILPNDLIRAFKDYSVFGDDVNQYKYDPQSKTGQKRINGSLVLGYRISNTITSNFEYTYNRVIPNGSSIPPRTNQEIRFNVKIQIRSR